MPLSRVSAITLSLLSGALVVALTGCGTSSSGSLKPSASPLAVATVSGMMHGGQQAIKGATVTLWAAGVTGTGASAYGANATSIATGATDANGGFSFNNVAGISPCTTGQHLYITGTGGDSGSGANSSIAVMAAIPQPCGASTGSQFVMVNEVSTIAAVWSLQQFMTITPGAAVPWQIGAPSTNATGLANAFTGVGQLVNLATGLTATSATSNTISNTVGGVTYITTIAPDYKTINTLADILAYCINSTGSTSCANLFADTTPGGAAAPTDTIQAAYYLATNAGGLTMPAHSDAAGAPHYLCGAYPSAQSPFQPILACSATGAATTVPTDWNIGVNWTTKSGSTVVGTQTIGAVAIDSSGNVWMSGVGGSNNGTFISQFNQAGQMIMPPVGSVTIPAYNLNYVVSSTGTLYPYAGGAFPLIASRVLGIAIDNSDNAWVLEAGTTTPPTLTSSGGTSTIGYGVVAKVTPAGVGTGYLTTSQPRYLAIDGSDNVWVVASPNVSGTFAFYGGELTAASGYQTFNRGQGGSTTGNGYAGFFIDPSPNQYTWLASSSTGCTNFQVPRENNATAPAGTATATVNLTSVCAAQGIGDVAGNAWDVVSGNLNYIIPGPIGTPVTTAVNATVHTITGSTNTSSAVAGGPGGLDYPRSIAMDGAGNLWITNAPAATFGGVSVFTPQQTGTATTVTPLSPSAAGVYGFSTFGTYNYGGIVIDNSGNVWLPSQNTQSVITHLVGAAAPVVTPYAAALKNGTVGARP